MILKRTVADDAAQPVTLDEMKKHLRIDFDAEDETIAAYLLAAIERAETISGRTLINSTWKYSLDAFPALLPGEYQPPVRATIDRILSAWANAFVIELPKPPLSDVQSVKYAASSNDLVELDKSLYVVDSDNDPGIIYPIINTYWPTTQAVPNAVQITYTAGYDNVPEKYKLAIKMMAAHFYNNRADNADVPSAARMLLQSGFAMVR